MCRNNLAPILNVAILIEILFYEADLKIAKKPQNLIM
jgi:hypothetical protein